MRCASGRLGSARLSRVGFGAAPKQTRLNFARRRCFEPATKVRNREQRPVAGVVDSGCRGHRPRLQLRRQHGRERDFAIDGLLRDIFHSGADF
jgi:hypothetical protein